MSFDEREQNSGCMYRVLSKVRESFGIYVRWCRKGSFGGFV